MGINLPHSLLLDIIMEQKGQLYSATGTASMAMRRDRVNLLPRHELKEPQKNYKPKFSRSLGVRFFNFKGLVMTCLGLASLAVLFEAMKVVQATTKQGLHTTSLGDSCPNECSPLLGAANIRRRRGRRCVDRVLQDYQHDVLVAAEGDTKHCLCVCRTWGLLCQTGLYLFQDTLGYLIMLCVMTYNGYFTVAVSLGAGLGYLVFGPALIEIGLNSASKIYNLSRDSLSQDLWVISTIKRRYTTIVVPTKIHKLSYQREGDSLPWSVNTFPNGSSRNKIRIFVSGDG
uniref:Copper transport protein n=1 Tax=Timema shepardi TaxID=629360 RepID=A0A7R9B832_TIMSH|nr:unnamed protein product [Timema shepardi]